MLRIVLLVITFILASCDSGTTASLPKRELDFETRFPVRMEHVLSHLRIAATEIEKARGLMQVASLAEAEGMAFMYDTDTRMRFWMKDTLIDLDIAFVAGDGTILEVRTMTARDIETTESASDVVRFAIEMRAGWFRDFGIKPGDKINVKDLRAALTARGFNAQKFLP